MRCLVKPIRVNGSRALFVAAHVATKRLGRRDDERATRRAARHATASSDVRTLPAAYAVRAASSIAER